MSVTTLQDPRRYFEAIGAARNDVAEQPPVCLYLEVTNRCNLLCETCPRTFEELEPPADMSWALFTRIVDQVPDVARVVLHGVGEPMLVKSLPKMIQYLKDRGTYVLFNTNGTLLNPKKFQEIIDTGLDELRVSLDAADRASYAAIRGKDFFNRIVRDVGKFTAYQQRMGVTSPRVSLWLTGLKETVEQLPEFVRLAASMGVKEVHLQRLVFDEAGFGKARSEHSLFEQTKMDEQAAIEAATRIGAALGVTLDASGATEPGLSLKRAADDKPWATCRRPWSLMYFTAHGRALPCCIAPFSARGYENYTLGDATQETLRDIWNSPAYRGFRTSLLGETPPRAVPELRAAMELVSVVIPTFNEAEAIGQVIREIPRSVAREVIVADGGSRDATRAIALAGGARVVDAGRGYGRACFMGAEAAESDVVVFLDGDGADRGDLLGLIARPVVAGTHDFVLASRTRGVRDPGSMLWHQVLAGRMSGLGMGALYGVRYSDMCAFRAIRRDALRRLDMREMTYGWNIEMQMKAARAGLRILEVPVPYRCRVGGESKVAGSLRGTLQAGGKIVSTFLRVATEKRPAGKLGA